MHQMSGNRGEAKTPGLIGPALTALLTVLLDQAAKWAAIHYLSSVDSLAVLPGVFHLTLVHNTGIAFGLLQHMPVLLTIFITFSIVLITIWLVQSRRSSALARFSIALILGGALGNWIDRMRYGAVIDFFDFRIWPVFNIADSAITVGMAGYCWLLFTEKRTVQS